MKFGVRVPQSQTTWEMRLSLCRWIDRDSNFDSVWLADHFVTGFGTAFASEGDYLESWSTLATLPLRALIDPSLRRRDLPQAAEQPSGSP